MKLFQRGCLVMDEVDLLLHPLKSELNFPLGDKVARDLNPELTPTRTQPQPQPQP